jgi:hypothetical protein
MGQTSLATGTQLEASARSAQQYGLAIDEAAKAIKAISNAGLNPAFADQIIRVGANLGAITGAGTVAGITQVTEAWKGGLETAIQLAMGFNKLTAAEATNFEEMGRHGQGVKALAQLLNLLDQRTTGLYKGSISEFTKATNTLSVAWNGLLDTLGKTIAPNLTKFFNDLAAVVQKLTDAIEYLKRLNPQGGGQSGQVIPLVPQGTTGTTGGTPGAGSLSTGQIYSFAKQAGFDDKSAQIMTAIVMAESGGDPGNVNTNYATDPGGSYGLAQINAKAHPTMMTPGVYDPLTNLQYAYEISGGGKNFNPWTTFKTGAYQQFMGSAAGGASGAPAGATVTGTPADIEKSAKALADLTRARQNDLEVSKAQGVQADILRAGQQAYDDALAKGLTPEDATKNRADAMAKAAAEGAAQWDKVTTATDRATLATRDITEAYSKGGLAVVEATAATQALEEITTHYGTAVGHTAEIEERRQQILTQMAQAEKLQNAQDLQSQKDTQAALQLEISLQGQSSDVITEQLTLLKAKQDIDEKFPLLSEKEKDARLASVKATADLNAQLQEASRNQQRINDTLTSIGQTIDSAVTQNIEAALSGQKITAWHDIFKNVLVQIEGQLLSLSVIKPAIGSVLGFLGFGGAAQSFGSLFSGAGILNPSGGGIFSGSTGTAGVTGGAQIVDSSGNVLGTISNAGSLLSSGSNLFGGGGGLFGSSGGIGGFINNNIGTSLGFAPTGLLPGSGAGAGIFTNAATGATSDIAGSGVAGGLFGGTTLTSALGGVAAGATAGSLLNSLLGPSIGGGKTLGGTIGSTGGALAGAIIGSIIPGIGTLIGGLVGGSAGGLLGGLFGAGKPNLASSGSVNLATGQLGAFTSGGVAANDQTSQAILQPIGSALSQITSILGASVLPQATLVAQAGSRDGIKVNIASGEGVKSFTGSDAGTVVQEVAQFLSQHMDLSGLSPTLGKIVSTLSLDQLQSADALTAAKQFADAYDQIKTAADQSFASVESGAQVAGPFEQAMTQITTTFGQLTDQATQYGLSLDPINAALAEATKRLNVDFAKAVDAAFNTASGSDFLNGIQSIVDNYQSMAREASAIGASGDVFNKLGQTFDDSLKTVFSSLTSTQLNQVIAQFGDLTNDLPALATTARDAAAATEALNAQLAQQTQIYQNQQNAYTAAGQGFLAQLRDLDQARIAAQAANASVGLGADQNAIVQETEHQAALNILMGLTTDQMEQARAVLADLNPAFAQWVDEAEAGVAATQAQADAQARANTILSAQANIQAYLNQLQTASSAFTDPKSRLDAAQSQYNTMLAAAQGGDLDALQGITTAAQTLLQNVSDYYASSAPGQAIFQQVQQQLQGLLGTVGPGPAAATTQDVVNAVNNSAAGTTATLNDQTAQIVNAGIASSKAITDNAIQANGTILAAAKVANDNIVNTTISTATDITNTTLQGAASIVGGTAQQFNDQTLKLVSSTGTVVDASKTTTAAVVSSGATVYEGTVALLNNNVANSASLIANNTSNAISTIQGNEQNAATLQAAGAAQTGAIIAGNTANAATITQRTTDTTNSLISANDTQTAALANTAQVTTDRAISAAMGNSTTEIGAISAWSNALLQSQVAWDNATIGTLNYWLGGLYSVSANTSNAIVQATFAAADSVVGTVAAWANYGIGIAAANANSIVSTETTTSNNEIAATYGAANSMVSAMAALSGSSTTNAVNNLTANLVSWGQNLYNAIGGLTSNEVAWNQNLYNKLQEILDNMIGWNRNLWDQLNNIREYIQFLAEVTVQFDEWMAGASGAQLDAMNSIQTTLRRQAFG